VTGTEYLWIITGIIIFGYVVGEILDWLNLRHSKKKLPPEADGIYDGEKYAKSQEYHRVTARFSFITSAFSTILMLTFLWLGGFGWIDGILSGYVENQVLLALAYFGTLFLASDIINIPFQIYSVFVIEERFGFNKTTAKTFVMDKLKGYIIGVILGGGILAALIYLVLVLGANFWLVFWVVIALFMLFMNMFYTTLILPLFNHYFILDKNLSL
jgi:STE24 endopeptidase